MQRGLFKNQVYSFTLKGWNFTKRIFYLTNPKPKRIGCGLTWTDEKEFSERIERERNLQEIEELEKLCYAEAEKAKQLRKDGISIQEKESQSTVNQLTVQIQEL